MGRERVLPTRTLRPTARATRVTRVNRNAPAVRKHPGAGAGVTAKLSDARVSVLARALDFVGSPAGKGTR